MRIGVMPSPQRSTWDDMERVVKQVDQLGYDSLWCSDHLLAPPPWPRGGAYECVAILGAWAAMTSRVMLGTMVGSMSLRDPALLTKSLTTIDHISRGRACLGVGAGWYDGEHTAFGHPFGSPAQRIECFSDALSVIRGLLRGEAVTNERRGYVDLVNLPPAVNTRLPVLIGGQGDRMLQLVAAYAYIWNVAGDLDHVRQREEVLQRLCEAAGRDHGEIERTYHAGAIVIRDDAREAERRYEELLEYNGIAASPDHRSVHASGPRAVGTVDDIASRLAPFVAAGFDHMYFDLLSPYDDETFHRLSSELRAALS